jgi:hypothetical protein
MITIPKHLLYPNPADMCDYTVEPHPSGGFQLIDNNQKWDTIYGFKTFEEACEEMESLNAAKDVEQLSHYVIFAQFEVLQIGGNNGR